MHVYFRKLRKLRNKGKEKKSMLLPTLRNNKVPIIPKIIDYFLDEKIKMTCSSMCGCFSSHGIDQVKKGIPFTCQSSLNHSRGMGIN
jgi:hypothetical protein